MKRVCTLALVAAGWVVLTGCEESYRDPYESPEVRKARDAAQIRAIANEAMIRDAEDKIRLIAAQNNIQLQPAGSVEITDENYRAVDALLKKLHTDLGKDVPILVASFVNLDNLNESSTFGRVVSEQMASHLRQKGYTAIEMKLRTTVFIKEGSGEFLLSRQLADIGIKHRARAVVVGTYAVGHDRVYITARIVDVADSKILSSYDYNLPVTSNIFKMLLKDRPDLAWL